MTDSTKAKTKRSTSASQKPFSGVDWKAYEKGYELAATKVSNSASKDRQRLA